MDCDILKLMIQQAAPRVDGGSATKIRLDAQVQKERDQGKTIFEKMFLYIDANAMSLPVTTYR